MNHYLSIEISIKSRDKYFPAFVSPFTGIFDYLRKELPLINANYLEIFNFIICLLQELTH